MSAPLRQNNPQAIAALADASAVYQQRGHLHQHLKSQTSTDVAAMMARWLTDPPRCLQTLYLQKLLAWLPGFKDGDRVDELLAVCGIRTMLRVNEIPQRQRRQVANALTGLPVIALEVLT